MADVAAPAEPKKIRLIHGGKESVYLVDNLALLLAAGLPPGEALSSIAGELKSWRLKRVMEQMRRGIDEGQPLWKTIGESGLFPAHSIALIKIGEESGRLSENLKVISEQQARQREFRAKVIGALSYPLLVFGLTLVIGLGIAWFILPRLATVFSSLKVKLPLFTRLLIAFGGFLGKYGIIFVPAVLISASIVAYIVFVAPGTRRIGQSLLLRMPVFKLLIQQAELANFGFTLGTLLQSGLPVVPALESLINSTDFHQYAALYQQLRDKVEEGSSIRAAMTGIPSSRRLIPGPIQQLVFSGEQSGTLAEVLVKVGQTFEAKIDDTAKNLTTLLEPILLVMVWLGVLFVALAVIVPLYSLVGNLNSGR